MGNNEYGDRDRRSHLHGFTDLSQFETRGAAVIERGEGIYLIDVDGKRYLDAMSSLWCATLGYSETRLAQAAATQLKKLPYSHSFRGRSHPPGGELAEKLVAVAPPQLTRVFFAGSGSEANESAVKMAWAYHRQRGNPGKRKIVSRVNAYHGSTIFASLLTDMPAMHDYLNLDCADILYADCPDYANQARQGESEAEFATRLARSLEALIEREGADSIAAFIAEPVMGVGGVILPPATYFEQVQALLKRHDILLIADEVICGFGRTGDLFGSLTFGLEPDILTAAKGLSSAYFPISATLVSDAVYQALLAITAEKGMFSHGFTYSAHPVGAAVALETLAITFERDIPARVRRLGKRLQAAVQRCCEIDIVANPRGVGLMAGFDLFADTSRRQKFDPGVQAGARVMDRAEKNGLFVRAVGDTIVLAPPLIISETEIDELERLLVCSMRQVADELGSL